MPIPFGPIVINVEDWVYGLIAAVIGGGAAAAVTGISLSFTDPTKFNIENPHIVRDMCGMFLVAGVSHGFMFLAGRPLPSSIAVAKITETIQVQDHLAAKTTTTTVAETQIIPTEEKK